MTNIHFLLCFISYLQVSNLAHCSVSAVLLLMQTYRIG